MSKLAKNLLSLFVLIAAVLGGFWYVTRTPEETVSNGVGVVVGESQSNPADEFAALLEQLSGVDFQGNNSIFRDPVFRVGLSSFRRDLPIIDRTRSNPFAPVEGDPSSYVRYPAPDTKTVATSTTSFPAASSTSGTTTGSGR